MPSVNFTIQLPDGVTRECYSPSTIVRSYFQQNEEMTVDEFVSRSREALTEASERVRAKFGFYCTSAAAQLADIERFSKNQPPEGTVRILSI
ncbi:MAG TPA: MSMEG_0570 family nitrogen starvation response protein [Verrucomicrobium sp.]|nr:MSMEG_0570 family nitrogen starvation response protein [Verrucomicrobium sp.]